MKAVIMTSNGGPEVLKWADSPDLTPGKQEVLIQVFAAGINNADVLQRKGLYPPPAGVSPLLGLEVAGVVQHNNGGGAGVTGFKSGDRVMALLSGGGYAEQVVVHESQVMKIPNGLSFEEATAIPEAFLTAYLELVRLGELKQGESVLIHAGASGVGTAAIQIAHFLGARVFTTAGSAPKLARCRELGAEVTINYREEAFDERILKATQGAGVNCILDLVGAAHLEKSLNSLALEGRLLMVGLSGGSRAEVNLRTVLAKRLKIIGSTLRARTLEDKAALVRSFERFSESLFEQKKLVPVLDRTFPVEDVVAAHTYLETQANIGKVVLKIR